MDNQTLLIIYRMIIAFGGILCIYLGYRLFRHSKDKQGKIELSTGQHFRLTASDLAPGIFFALFGAAVLIFSLIHGMTLVSSALPGTSQTTTYNSAAERPGGNAGNSADVPPNPTSGGGFKYSTGEPPPSDDPLRAKSPP